MKRLYTIIVLLAHMAYLNGQDFTLKGQVQDQKGQPMEFANVLLYNSIDTSFVKGMLTDEGGAYLMDKVEAGTYIIEITQLGFSTQQSAVIYLNEGDQAIHEVPLIICQEGIALEEVTVTGQRPLIELEADKVVMNVSNSSIEIGNTALEVLQKSPGVTVDQDNNIALKGKQGVLILIDGKNQYVSNDQLSRLLETMPAEFYRKN